MRAALLLPGLLLTGPLGCGATGPIPDAAGLPGGDAERPPSLDADTLETWLARGLYKAWRCEATPDTSRRGAHGATRICSNLLQASAVGVPYPVGAASVKELWDGDGKNLRGYSFAIRTAAGDGGQNRFWYERDGGRPVFIGTGLGTCTGCHSAAPLDYTYVTAK